jgi:hypothetical protein
MEREHPWDGVIARLVGGLEDAARMRDFTLNGSRPVR